MKPIIRQFEKFRYFLFWLVDFSTGSEIKIHFKDIESILEQPNAEKSLIKRTKYIQALLKHAVMTTSFYQTYNPQANLSSFPVINKNLINKEFSKFQSSKWSKVKCKKVTTSGSTGALLTVIQDPNKIKRNTADNLYFSKKAGFKMGTKLYYLRHWSSYFKKNKGLQWLQNIRPVEVIGLYENSLSSLIQEIKQDTSIKGWLGYASGFESICQYLDSIASQPLDVGFKSIIAISEHLSEQTRQRMSYYFKAPVVSRYSNMENGILAQQPVNQTDYYLINWASYHIEVLDLEQDTPVSNGKIGRIVVTDLFNYATPMIRYDTGDLGIMDLNKEIQVLKRIEGRSSDSIYNTDGQLVSSFMIIDACNFKGIHQIQLIQQSKKHYNLKLNVSQGFIQEKELMKRFKNYLGEDSKIEIDYVQELPVLNSGKQKITINNS